MKADSKLMKHLNFPHSAIFQLCFLHTDFLIQQKGRFPKGALIDPHMLTSLGGQVIIFSNKTTLKMAAELII